ncbi:uncharacterized protein LOC115243968 [Formica exsecta]|uniref:uncharacterized protein LOC115243968 n=1 Tax=Formica exsecta TaxID=72781 RepID=UPI001144A49E|nr:uncharacterized protein LOC115243968 [Formica exsecta]
MTMSRKLHPTARATRECGCRPASPTRRNEVHGVVDDDRRCRRSGKPRMRHIGRSVTMPSAYERLARTALYQRCPGSENRITSAGWTSRLFEIIPRGPGTGTSIGGKWREIVSDLYSGRMDLSGKTKLRDRYLINLQLDFFNLCLSSISLLTTNKANENLQPLLQRAIQFLSSLKVRYVVQINII